MSDALSLAVSGLNNAASQIANTASSIVKASSTQNNSTSANSDLATDFVTLSLAKTDYGASAAIVKAVQKDNQTLEHALDITA